MRTRHTHLSGIVSLLLVLGLLVGALAALPVVTAADEPAPQVAITTINGNSNSTYIGYAETNFKVNSDFYFFNNKPYTDSNPDAVRASGTYKFMYAAPASGASGNLPKMVLGYNSTNYTMRASSYFSGTTTQATQRGIGYQGAVFTNNTTKAQYAIVQGVFDIQWSKYTLAPNATQTTFTGAVEELVAAVQDVAGTKIPVIVSLYSTGDTTDLASLLPSGVSLLSVNTVELNSFVFGMNGVSLDATGSMTGKFSGSPYSRNLFTMPELGPNRTVKFYDGENQIGDALVVPNETDITSLVPKMKNKTGEKFVGWYDSTLTTPINLTSIEADTNAYAKYEAAATYTVTFLDKDGNNLVDPQIIASGEAAEVPTPPDVQDLAFVGWFDEGDNEVTDFSSITKDVTVQAKYRAGILVTLRSAQDVVDFMTPGSPDWFELGCDIDMSGVSWKPFDFNMSLDGNGYTMSGLTGALFNSLSGAVSNITFSGCKAKTTGGNMAILAMTAVPGAVISNVNIVGGEVMGTQAAAFIASIPYAAGEQVQFFNCTVDATTVITPNGGNRQIGGFVGDGDAYIDSCTFSGSFGTNNGKGSCNFGGFIGRTPANSTPVILNSTFNGTFNMDETNQAGVGGFIGTVAGTSARIENCESNGTFNVSTSYVDGIGGFIGSGAGGGSGKESGFSITKCTNNSVITAPGGMAGGFVGNAALSKGNASITDSVNNANITGLYAGGFVGAFNAGSFGGNGLTLTGCINAETATVSGNYASQFIGMAKGKYSGGTNPGARDIHIVTSIGNGKATSTTEEENPFVCFMNSLDSAEAPTTDPAKMEYSLSVVNSYSGTKCYNGTLTDVNTGLLFEEGNPARLVSVTVSGEGITPISGGYEMTYSGDAPAPSFTVTETLTGKTVNAVCTYRILLGEEENDGIEPGTYTLEVTFAGDEGHDATVATFVFRVNKIKLSYPANEWTVPNEVAPVGGVRAVGYTGNEQSVELVFDDKVFSVEYGGTFAATDCSAEPFTATATLKPLDDAHYTFSGSKVSYSLNWTIAKGDAQFIIVNDTDAPVDTESLVYDGNSHAYYVVVVNGDGDIIDRPAENMYAVENAGIYKKTVSYAGAANYNAIPETEVSFTVAPASVALVIDDLSGTYDANPVDPASAIHADGGYTWGIPTVLFETSADDGATWTAVDSVINAGFYRITVSILSEDGNHKTENNATFTIAKKTADLAGIGFADTEKTYDGTTEWKPEVTNLPEYLTYELSEGSVTVVTDKQVTATFSIKEGYEVNYAPAEVMTLTANITVVPATADLTGVTFSDAEKTYDGKTEWKPTLEGVPAYLDVTLSEGSVGVVSGKEVTATFKIKDAYKDQYKDAESMTMTAHITVTAAQVTITADDSEVVFDNTVKTLNVTAEDTNGVDFSAFLELVIRTGNAVIPANEVLGAGEYTFTWSFSDTNITATPLTRTLTVKKAQYDLADVRVVGDERVLFDGKDHTRTLENLPTGLDGVTLAVTTPAASYKQPGVYDLTMILTGSDNYETAEYKTTLVIAAVDVPGDDVNLHFDEGVDPGVEAKVEKKDSVSMEVKDLAGKLGIERSVKYSDFFTVTVKDADGKALKLSTLGKLTATYAVPEDLRGKADKPDTQPEIVAILADGTARRLNADADGYTYNPDTGVITFSVVDDGATYVVLAEDSSPLVPIIIAVAAVVVVAVVVGAVLVILKKKKKA